MDLYSLEYSNQYELYFINQLLPYLADLLLGDSSGLRAVSNWYIHHSANLGYHQLSYNMKKFVCRRAHTMNSQSVAISDHI